MTLYTLLFGLLALLCVASAVFQWATYHRAWGMISQNERHIASLRSKISYDEGKVADMIDERLSRLERERPESGGTDGFDPGSLMQMMMMMQGPQGMQQPPQQPPQQPEKEADPDPDEDPMPDPAVMGDGWLTDPAQMTQ